MRILILANANSTHVLKWVAGLKAKGAVLAVYSLSPLESENQSYYQGVELRHGDTCLVDSSSFAKLNYFKRLPDLKRFIADFKPDILHAHYASSYGLLAAFSGFKNYVVSAWGSDVYAFPKSNPVNRAIIKKAFKKAAAVYSTSKDMARVIQKYTTKKPEIIPFGVDVERFKPSEKAKGPVTKFVTTKSHFPIYRIPEVVEAFRRVVELNQGLNIELYVAGDGPEFDRARVAAGACIDRAIHFTGRIHPDDMPAFLANKDVLINVPVSESFGVGILEASSAELAVIATRAGGIPEVLEDGKTGVLIPSSFTNELEKAIVDFAMNPDKILAYGKDGREFIKAHFDWNICLDMQWNSYQKLLGKGFE